MKHPIAALLVVAALGTAVRCSLGIQTSDDAFITFRYSQHIAAGEGFTYNPPERILGTSTPLFALTMAAAAKAGFDVPTAAFVVSLIADLASMALLTAILRALGYPLAAVLTTIAFAMAPSVVVYSVSGMETSLYVAIVLLAVWALQQERWPLAALAAGLAWFCRPDGVLLAAVVSASALHALPWRRTVTVMAIIAAVILPWITFATLYFGSPIPGSIFAKADMARDPLAGVRVFKAFFLTFPMVIPSVMALLGAIVLWRSRVPAVRSWLAWGGVYTVIFTASRAFDGYMWYFTPLMPLFFAAGAVLIESHLRPLMQRVPWWVKLQVAAVYVLVCLVPLDRAEDAVRWSQSTREVPYKRIAAELSAITRDCPIAALEIGALGYHYPGPIVDLAGIVTPQAVGKKRGDVLLASDACWLVSYDENLVALDPTFFDNPGFREQFALRERLPISERRSLVVYERTAR